MNTPKRAYNLNHSHFSFLLQAADDFSSLGRSGQIAASKTTAKLRRGGEADEPGAGGVGSQTASSNAFERFLRAAAAARFEERRFRAPVILSSGGNDKQEDRMKMPMKRHGAKGESSSQLAEPEEPRMNIRSIMKDIEFLDNSHMTWKQKKDLENRKVVSLGGKPQKKQRLPLSVARVVMKKQKEREEKSLQESAILGRFGAYFSSSSGDKHVVQKRQPEDRVLRSTEGNFRNGVLDVKHLLKPSSAPRVPRADVGDDKDVRGHGKGKKKKKGGKKGGGKNRKGGGKKRH